MVSQSFSDALVATVESWQGCDWQTQFGPKELNLQFVKARQATLLARATRADESESWAEAAQWLQAVEEAAVEAAELAKSALESVKLGKTEVAKAALARAAEIEARYRKPGQYAALFQQLADETQPGELLLE